MLGPYIKSRGTRGTKMSANADLITMKTFVQGKTIENQFLIYGPKCNFVLHIWLFVGPWGIQLSDWAYLDLQLSIYPYLCTYEIRKQAKKNI